MILFQLAGVWACRAEDEGRAKYTILAGDRIRLSVMESPDLNAVYPVSGDGTVDLGYFGRVLVADLSVEQAAQRIEELLEKSYFKKATVHVEVSDFVQGAIFVQGAVKLPATLESGGGLITLMEAIARCGGVNPNADASHVRIIRWKYGAGLQRETITVDLQSMIDNFDYSKDQFLRPRDIIFVPTIGKSDGGGEFLILGEVSQNGFYPVMRGVDLIRAITMAGGVSKDAKMDAARLLRPEAGGSYKLIPLNLLRLFGGGDISVNIPLEAGDIIFVPSKEYASAGRVYFLGEIATPGMYPLPLDKEATLARTILSLGGFTKFANESKVKVVRVSPGGDKQTLYFDVGSILKRGAFDEDIPLRDEDVIIVAEKVFAL